MRAVTQLYPVYVPQPGLPLNAFSQASSYNSRAGNVTRRSDAPAPTRMINAPLTLMQSNTSGLDPPEAGALDIPFPSMDAPYIADPYLAANGDDRAPHTALQMLNGAAPGPTGMIPASSVPKWPASIDPIAGADIPAPHIEPMALDPRERQKDLEQEYSVAAWPGNAYRNKPGAASDEGSGSSNARLSSE